MYLKPPTFTDNGAALDAMLHQLRRAACDKDFILRQYHPHGGETWRFFFVCMYRKRDGAGFDTFNAAFDWLSAA